MRRGFINNDMHIPYTYIHLYMSVHTFTHTHIHNEIAKIFDHQRKLIDDAVAGVERSELVAVANENKKTKRFSKISDEI